MVLVSIDHTVAFTTISVIIIIPRRLSITATPYEKDSNDKVAIVKDRTTSESEHEAEQGEWEGIRHIVGGNVEK